MTKSMTKDELAFAIFCVECVADEVGLKGDEVYGLMITCPGMNVLDDYIIKYYDTLHTQGRMYLVDDILELMRKNGAKI
ncbi:MAG: hypothetical protein Ta2B_21420 [Termitinemataceae bacterium]|nr:MAG: hypothetical protein Ta2B_21420 [Termitinemataceae bacterium]